MSKILCYVFSQALHTLIALQKRYITSIGKLTPAEEDNIWQVIIGQRVEVNSGPLHVCLLFVEQGLVSCI